MHIKDYAYFTQYFVCIVIHTKEHSYYKFKNFQISNPITFSGKVENRFLYTYIFDEIYIFSEFFLSILKILFFTKTKPYKNQFTTKIEQIRNIVGTEIKVFLIFCFKAATKGSIHIHTSMHIQFVGTDQLLQQLLRNFPKMKNISLELHKFFW